jgi:hypothetical protein
MMATYDPVAVRHAVEEATACNATNIAHACGWTDGNPEEITVDERLVTVRYGGPLPRSVAGPLREEIVEYLRMEGFDYRGYMYGKGEVRIIPSEDD